MLDLSHRLGKRKGLSEPHGAALPEACIDRVRQADAARAGTERVEQPIIQAVRRRIQGSVGRKNGDAARDAAEQRPLRGVAPAQALEALEDRWMVGDDQLGSEGFGFEGPAVSIDTVRLPGTGAKRAWTSKSSVVDFAAISSPTAWAS